MVGLQISSAIVIAMTSRTYHVCPDGKKFRIQVRTMYEKASKRVLYERRGYPCSNSANNEVTRLIKFFRDGNGKITDFQSCYTNVSNCRNLAVKMRERLKVRKALSNPGTEAASLKNTTRTKKL